ncbi:MAG: hypothetical protein COA81_05915 [Alphaproteobacteria bacterium]|nr:MAG: hypothetical protein COA81_05915 [Alphaproteobacteria bacterium]
MISSKNDNAYRAALRSVFVTENRILPQADIARQIINSFLNWLEEHNNIDAPAEKINKLAHKFLHSVWGIDIP